MPAFLAPTVLFGCLGARLGRVADSAQLAWRAVLSSTPGWLKTRDVIWHRQACLVCCVSGPHQRILSSMCVLSCAPDGSAADAPVFVLTSCFCVVVWPVLGQARLGAGYYRSLHALLHDAALMASNALTFNGTDSPLTAAAQQMQEELQSAACALQGQQQEWAGSMQWAQQPAGTYADAADGGGGGGAVGQAGWDVHWQAQWAGSQQGWGQQGDGLQDGAAVGQHGGEQEQEQQQQRRPRIRLRMRPPSQQQQPQQQPRSRRSAACRARAFVASHLAGASSDSDVGSGADEEDLSGSSDGGRRRRRVAAGQPKRSSARLQRQGAARQQYREQYDSGDDSGDDR